MPKKREPNEPSRSTTFVGAYEAKNGLGQLLDRVEQGETIIITRHGKPVAKLVPFAKPVDRAAVAEAFAVFDRIRQKARMTTEEIVALIREGRER